MIQLKTPEEVALMRSAGLIVADALAAMREAVAPGVSTGDLDAVADRIIRDAGAVPSFLGYRGFPKSMCASINEEIVHGIPNSRRVLAEGDVVSLDCGAIYHGYHGDAAISVAVGEVAPEVAALMAVTEASLWAGLARALPGGRLTDISHAVEASVRSRSHHYGIVDHYGGHGIGTEMHQDPHVLNFGRPGRGPRLVPGLCLAIEPMVTLGDPATEELGDGWTVITKDGSMAAHFEHTVAITADGPLVTTAHDGGRAGLAMHDVSVAV